MSEMVRGAWPAADGVDPGRGVRVPTYEDHRRFVVGG